MVAMLHTGRTLAVFAFGANFVSICYGIYFLAVKGRVLQPAFFGTVLLAALILNLVLIYLNIMRDGRPGLQRWGGIYLILSPVAMLTMSVGGHAASSVSDPRVSTAILAAVVFPLYFFTLVVGSFHAWFSIPALRHTGVNISAGSSYSFPAMDRGKGRKMLLAALYTLLASGLFFAYILLTDYPGLLQVPVAPNALFLAFIYPALALLILKINGKPRRPASLITAAVGLVLLAVFMLPAVMTPAAAARADAEFTAAFGDDWRERLDPAWNEYFLTVPFSVPAYFLGFFPGDYTWRRQILFYEGKHGVDEGLQLYYDVYMPLERNCLPGQGSIIIRIHGGAWISGDKGVSNMLQMNKYLAAQGYTVFDIQYGLTTLVDLPQIMLMYDFLSSLAHLIPRSSSFSTPGAPSPVTGPFTLDDMIRHLGIFTGYLAEHSGMYGGSPESVFVSGGSAGGHLATAMSLAIAGGEHDHIFDPGITVKGYVPFYPANRATPLLENIGGAAEWLDVERLVRQDSPPCLIFQGAKDGLVPRDTARYFKESYQREGNERCAVMYLPLAAHGSDYLFAGYYNQLFLYYMERFLALHR